MGLHGRQEDQQHDHPPCHPPRNLARMGGSLPDRHAQTVTSERTLQESSHQGASRQEQITPLQRKVPLQTHLRTSERIQKTNVIQRYYYLRVYTPPHACQLILRRYHPTQRLCKGAPGPHRAKPATLVRRCRSEPAEKTTLQ